MREYKYYEFTITKRDSFEILSKRVVKSNEDIGALHYLEWLYFRFHFAKLGHNALRKDYNVKSRRLSEEESKPYIEFPFGNLFENQIKHQEYE
jgi:hypothetical protein